MRKGFLFVVWFILLSGIVYAQPLKYIGNPYTMECKEYSVGGIRPENFNEDLGDVGDFKNIDQACDVFKCTSTGGTILVDENGEILEEDLCRCPEDKSWDESRGCVSGGGLITGTAVFVPEKSSGLNYLVIIISILVITALIFFIKKVKK